MLQDTSVAAATQPTAPALAVPPAPAAAAPSVYSTYTANPHSGRTDPTAAARATVPRDDAAGPAAAAAAAAAAAGGKKKKKKEKKLSKRRERQDAEAKDAAAQAEATKEKPEAWRLAKLVARQAGSWSEVIKALPVGRGTAACSMCKRATRNYHLLLNGYVCSRCNAANTLISRTAAMDKYAVSKMKLERAPSLKAADPSTLDEDGMGTIFDLFVESSVKKVALDAHGSAEAMDEEIAKRNKQRTEAYAKKMAAFQQKKKASVV